MAHSDQSAIDFNVFFRAPATIQHFALLDYNLRAGNYLQAEHPQLRTLFYFLEEHEVLLRWYYRTLFGLKLDRRSYLDQPYYFLAPTEDTKDHLPAPTRHELEPHHILVGLLLCQLTMVDQEDPRTVEELLRLLVRADSPYRDGVYRHLASLKRSSSLDTSYNLDQIRHWCKRSIEKFCWAGLGLYLR